MVKKNPAQVNAQQTAPSDDEKEMLRARLQEIEEELYALTLKDEERQRDYEQKVKEMDIQKIESELAAEAEELKAEYPEFDVEAELSNPAFARLVNSGLPMKTAYEAVHIDEIRKKGVSNAEKKALEEYKKSAQRPDENGISLSQGGILKSGVHSLSKRDRDEIAKRARRGEVISF